MSISGSGNIPPMDPNNWDPSVMGKSTESSHEPNESASLKATDQGAFASPLAQSSLLSGASFDYEFESPLNEYKYKKTQSKSLSVKGKLQGSFSKAKASTRGFLSGFGSRISRLSARKAELKEGGRSCLPSNMDMVSKKGNRVSPELRGFYLQASGVSSHAFDVSTLSKDSLAVESFMHKSSTPIEVQLDNAQQPFKTFKPLHQDQSIEEKTNVWLASRLGGEMVSTLLDPNVETSALLRRASTAGNESLDDLLFTQHQHVSTPMVARRSELNEVADLFSSVNSSSADKLSDIKDEQAANKKDNQDLSKEQLAISRMMASLLVATPSSEAFVPYPLASIDSGMSLSLTKSSGILRSFDSEHQPLGIEKQTRHVSFYRDLYQKNKHEPFTKAGHLGVESSYRWFKEDSSNSLSDPNNQGTAFVVDGRNSTVTYQVPHSSSDIPYKASADALDREVLTSSFQFSADRGVALLPDRPMSLESYKHQIQEHKGPGAPPDPLIYQYRNVSVDPPIILRSPQPFATSGKIQVQGKPEAASVHDDGQGGSQQFSNNHGESETSQEQEEINKKRKARKIE